MQTLYDIEGWAAGTTGGRQLFNYNYRMHGRELAGWKLVKVVTLQEDRDATHKAYFWEGQAGAQREMIRVDITERHSWRLAQDSLRQQLLQSMRMDIPRGTRDVAQLGDVVFEGREPQTDVAAAISFTRGNVLVSVRSAGETTVDVSAVAARLDRALSELPAARTVASGRARALATASVAVAPHQAGARGEWLKVIVPDGEISRKGDALLYEPAEGGQKRVSIFAISR
jgi:hypothetical protein